jgi:hypothetical protein
MMVTYSQFPKTLKSGGKLGSKRAGEVFVGAFVGST